ncbi:MAG: M3 family oligoendopeptidase [archaeon]
MFKQKRWDLSELLPATSGSKFEKYLNELEHRVKKFESFRKELKPGINAKRFLQMVSFSEELFEMASRIGAYPSLQCEADVADPKAIALKTRVETFLTHLANRTLFFSLFWKKLDEKNVNRILKEAGKYTYYLKYLRKLKPYILKENEEQIINLKDLTGANTLDNLYSTITGKLLFDFNGKKLTQGEILKLVRDPNPKTREKAYTVFLDKYSENKEILGEIFKALILDWKNENLLLRKFKKPISPRNLANDIPDDVIETVFEVCKENNHIFNEYFKLKAKTLGIKLTRYDLYAPVGKESNKIPFSKAVDLSLDNFKQLSPEFHNNALKIFKKDHVDSEVRKNKCPGAFCASISPKLLPYILTNYTGNPRDVLTIAHELGHGIHSIFASKNPLFTFHSGLPLAETASVFSETMMFDRLVELADKNTKKNLLFSHLDEIYATVSRQIHFAMFEKEIHSKISEVHSIEEISKIYYKSIQQSLGNLMKVPEKFSWEWLHVSYIFQTPFYAYAYSFGNLLALALYEQFKKDGKKTIPKLINILSAGGNQEPVKLLLKNGFDIRKKEFWQQGFDKIKAMVEELKELT